MIDVDGRVPDEFHGGGLGPRTAEEARAWLRREGVPLDADDRAIGGRYHPWNWDDDAGMSRSAAATTERNSSDLPADISDLQALAGGQAAKPIG